MIWTFLALRQCESHRGKVFVNYRSTFTKKTVLGNNVHFNGMRIAGNGRVRIEDHFHSGIDCKMVTSFHDYDGGDAIPYGFKNIDRDIQIERSQLLVGILQRYLKQGM